jgi:hypothetical protein
MPSFDPDAYKNTTREQWQTAAAAWNNWGGLLRDWLGPATEIMFDMAGIGRGSRVLIVAAGAGDEALQAADRVGPRVMFWQRIFRRTSSNSLQPTRGGRVTRMSRRA